MSESILDCFLAKLATDPSHRKAFLENSKFAMYRARLTPEEQAVVRKNKLTTILEYLEAGGPRPTPPERQIGDGNEGGQEP